MLAVLWAGSLWATALWFAPVLFHFLPDRHAAGLVAAEYFRIESYLSIAVAGFAALLGKRMHDWPLYMAALLLAVNELLLRQTMSASIATGAALGLSFSTWHGISGGVYVLACCLALSWWWRSPN
jgi:Domain of unknown function (DUF4149)